MLSWENAKANVVMKNIIKILILLYMLVNLYGCSASKPVQDMIVEDTVELLTNEEYTSEAETETETESEIKTDPFGRPVGSDLGNYFPLYAMIEEENIYLYGIHERGMILYQNGKGTYFDWPGITGRTILPQMVYHDFDSDGKKELAVTLYWGAGTGAGLMDLHILEIEDDDSWEKPTYTDYALLALDVTDWMKEPIKATLSEDKKTLTVETCGSKYVIDSRPEDTFEGIGYEDFVHFNFEGTKIKMDVSIYASYDELPGMPVYFGEIEANVNFVDGNFHIEDYSFSLDLD